MILDNAGGELVENRGYGTYGHGEHDCRTARWQNLWKEYGSTGKEADVEVGLTYFGKRFLVPNIGRWLNVDPLALHAPGSADANVYAYVSGRVFRAVEPLGLEGSTNDSSGGVPQPERDTEASNEGAGQTQVGHTFAAKIGEAGAKPHQPAEVQVQAGDSPSAPAGRAAPATHELPKAQSITVAPKERFKQRTDQAQSSAGGLPSVQSTIKHFAAADALQGHPELQASRDAAGRQDVFVHDIAPLVLDFVAPGGRALKLGLTADLKLGGKAAAAGLTAAELLSARIATTEAAGAGGAEGGVGPVLKGRAGVERAIAEIEANGGTIFGREITIEANGVRTRPDLPIRTAEGEMRFVEVKNGPRAALTRNQAKAFPGIQAGGAIPHRANAAAAGLKPGTALPPTPVDVLHY